MIKSKPYALLGAIALAMVASQAAAGTEFLAYEGRDAVQDGQGGDKKVVDGVDFWMDGAPPHRFQILGALVDERWQSGLIGLMRMADLEHDIAKQARAAGGDAVILTDSHENIKGYTGSTFGSASFGSHSAFGSSSSFSHAVGSHSSRFMVVKYLPDPPGPPSGPGVAPAPAAP